MKVTPGAGQAAGWGLAFGQPGIQRGFPRTRLSPETHGRKADIAWGPVAARISGSISSLQEMLRLSLRRTPNHPSAALPHPGHGQGLSRGMRGQSRALEGAPGRDPQHDPHGRGSSRLPLPQRRSCRSARGSPRGCSERIGSAARPEPSPSARVPAVPLPVSPRCPRQAPVSPRYRRSCPRGAAPARCRVPAVPLPVSPLGAGPARCRSGPVRCRSCRSRRAPAAPPPPRALPRRAPPSAALTSPPANNGRALPAAPRFHWPSARGVTSGPAPLRGEATPLWRRGGGA